MICFLIILEKVYSMTLSLDKNKYHVVVFTQNIVKELVLLF